VKYSLGVISDHHTTSANWTSYGSFTSGGIL
jgi:hypothetical protein